MKTKKAVLMYSLALLTVYVFAQEPTGTDYVLNGHVEVAAFATGGTGEKEAVGKLTVYGQDVTQADFNSLADRIKSCGTVTFENFTNGTGNADPLSVGNIGGFFLNVTCNGGIIFRNCAYMTLPEGFNYNGKMLSHIHGDFIMDRCNFAQPGIDGWAEDLFWGGIEQVDGDFIITHYTNKFSHGVNGYKLKKVGGNFEISHPVTGGNTPDNAVWSYETGFQNLESVGGNFTIDGDNFAVNNNQLKIYSLDCLTNIQFIGGNVRIVNLPNLGIPGQGDHPFGYCFVRYLIDAAIIDYAHFDVQIGNGPLIDLAKMGGCPDGITPDNPPLVPPCEPKFLPTVPTGLTATAGSSGISLTWKASDSAAGSDVYRGTTAGGESTIPIAHNITTLNYIDNNVNNGTTYYYKVKAINPCGSSDYSNEASATLSTVGNLNDLKNSICRISVTNGALIIDSKTDLMKVEIFNLTGSSLLKFTNVPSGITLHNVLSLLNGVYIIRLTSDNMNNAVYKIIK